MRGDVPQRFRSLATRPVTAALLLLAVYALVAAFHSGEGYLGTDTGAKVITVDRMVEDGTSSPAVGYWAEAWDPDGDYHPLFDSRQNEDGEWINVTTLPMLLVARPLYDLGGYRLALLLPMLGAIGAAFAGRDLARQLGGDDEAGWISYWVIGLASPVAIYAVDFWEHAIGAGAMLGAVTLLVRVVRGAGPVTAVGAGALLGASAAMRAEAFVVALVAVGAACLALLVRREVGRSVLTGALAVAGFAVPWVANAWLERDLGGNSRSNRVSTEAQREFWTEVPERAEEALVTWFGVPGFGFPQNAVLGAVAVASIVWFVVLHRRGEPSTARLPFAVAVAVYALALAGGLGFVSGALVAVPVAAVAALYRGGPWRAVLGATVVATVLTWTFQLTGGAGPQWGGRYLLVPTLVLVVVGVLALRQSGPAALVPIVGLAAVVTAFGFAWLVHRSHVVDEFFDDLADRPEDVIVVTNGFLVREAGPAYEDHRYLALGRGADLDGAVAVVEDAGLATFAVLTGGAAAPDLDAEPVASERLSFLGSPIWYHTYRLG